MYKTVKALILVFFPVFIAQVNTLSLAQDYQSSSSSYTTNDSGYSSTKTGGLGYWIIDTSTPGSDIPAVGQSVFDMIVSDYAPGQTKTKIPFPFPKLIEKIKSHMESSADSIKQVRIPIGRSLRRNIAAPDFFHSPRIIIATDSQPKSISGHAGLNLKGRLFIGYQEKSNLLEIISYNPWAGRFEFQEVSNYGPDLIPKVLYSNRTLCLSCHQNAGPVFSKEPWLETDSNQQVSLRLPRQSSTSNVKTEYLPRFDNVWALDYATDRANYFASSQFIWQKGCDGPINSSTLIAIQCRAAMFTAILEYHLLGYVNQNSKSFREWFLPTVLQNWQQKWPDGLLIATADIADKNPFSISTISTQDPLNPRPPRAKWLKPSAHLLTGIIYQTADFITENDIYQIDQFLKQQAVVNKLPTSRFQSNCNLKRTADIGSQMHLDFSCRHAKGAVESGFSASGAFIIEDNRIIDGNVNTLTLPSASANLRFLDLAKANIQQQGEFLHASIPINKYETLIGARLFNGTLIRELKFKWPATLKEFNTASDQPASLITVDDIQPLNLAIAKMIKQNQFGKNDALSSKPFRRHSLIKSLHKNLGMPALKWQQDQPNSTMTRTNKSFNIVNIEKFSAFYRHCASCHSTKTDFPPGFLAGTANEVEQQLKQCAKKILVRLNMWKSKPEDRLISPMPPSSWLSIAGFNERNWLNSKDLMQMQKITEELIINNHPLPPQLSKPNSVCL